MPYQFIFAHHPSPSRFVELSTMILIGDDVLRHAAQWGTSFPAPGSFCWLPPASEVVFAARDPAVKKEA